MQLQKKSLTVHNSEYNCQDLIDANKYTQVQMSVLLFVSVSVFVLQLVLVYGSVLVYGLVLA